MSEETELAALMPWLYAQQESWWSVTGTYGGGRGTFTTCLARVLPQIISGSQAPIFEVLIYGDTSVIPASAITSATELFLVHANDPRRAYYQEDQVALTAALRAPTTP